VVHYDHRCTPKLPQWSLILSGVGAAILVALGVMVELLLVVGCAYAGWFFHHAHR
jgi:hypothetical protein